MEKRETLTRGLADLFLQAGFADVGTCEARSYPEMQALIPWLEAGNGGLLPYMRDKAASLLDPRVWYPAAQWAIVGIAPFRRVWPEPSIGSRTVASYALFQDYHKVLGRKLKAILAEAGKRWGLCGRFFVDAAPVMEKVLARQAGLGAWGKNSCLFHPTYGSSLFIGGLLLDTSLERLKDQLSEDPCGDCTLCLEACPGKALDGRGTLRLDRCLSYLTIEHRGEFDPAAAALVGRGGFVFGCDLCLSVCPHNQRVVPQESIMAEFNTPRFAPEAIPALVQTWGAPEHPLGDTPLARAGAVGLARNLAAVGKPMDRQPEK